MHRSSFPDERLPFITVNGVRLKYDVRGRGKAIVLVHGVGGSLHSFDGIAPALSARGKVVRLDLRGFGKSDKPTDHPYSLDEWSRDLASLLAALKIRRAVVVGHSMGGRIACRFAAMFPGMAAGLVTLDTTAWGSNPEGARQLSRGLERVEKEGMSVFFEKAPWFQRLQLKVPALARKEEKENLKNDPRAYSLAVETIIRDFTGETDSSFLAGISCPTLIAVGDRDSAPVSGAQEMQRRIPGSSLAVIPDAGHFSFYEKPEIVLSILEDFLERAGLPR